MTLWLGGNWLSGSCLILLLDQWEQRKRLIPSLLAFTVASVRLLFCDSWLLSMGDSWIPLLILESFWPHVNNICPESLTVVVSFCCPECWWQVNSKMDRNHTCWNSLGLLPYSPTSHLFFFFLTRSWVLAGWSSPVLWAARPESETLG